MVINPLAKVYDAPVESAVADAYILAMGTKVYYRKYSADNKFSKIIMPVEKDGKLQKQEFYLQTTDLSTDPLPLTYKNIAVQAFKFWGSGYGWGGSINKTDCSLFLYRVFASFGIELPRRFVTAN